MYIYICEDNTEHQRNIKNMITLYFDEKNIACRVQCFGSGSEMLEAFDQESEIVDAFFMDIELGDNENGLDVAKELIRRQKNCQMIYISSYNEYVFEVFETSPVDYLVKPVNRERLFRALDRVCEKEKQPHKIPVRVDKKIIEMDVNNIMYIQSQGRQLQIFMTQGQCSTYEKMDDLLSRLKNIKGGFIRIHKSFIINYEYVLQFKNNEVIMGNGVTLTISRPYRQSVKEYSMEYLQQKVRNFG